MIKLCFVLLSAVMLMSSCSDDVVGPDITAPDSVKSFTSSREGTGDMLIQLVWDANKEKDLAGYLLYRKQDPEVNYVFVDTVYDEMYIDTVTSYTAAYSYEIFAFDKSGNISEGNKNAYGISSPDFYAPVPIDSISLAPKNRGLNTNFTLTWKTADIDIDYFNIIKETASTKAVIVVDTMVSSYVIDSIFIDTMYTFSVQAVDFAGKSSIVNTKVTDVILPKPTLLYPSNDTVITTPTVTFTWKAVNQAVSYEFILNQGKDLIDTLVAPVVGTQMSLTLDLSAIAGLEAGMPATWNILTYSKADGSINSSADKNAGFTYTK